MKKIAAVLLIALFMGSSATTPAYSDDWNHHGWGGHHDWEEHHRGLDWVFNFGFFPQPRPVVVMPVMQPVRQAYYCAAPSGYYPYVSACSMPWQIVAVQ